MRHSDAEGGRIQSRQYKGERLPLGRTALLPTPSPRGLAPKTPKTLYTLYRTLFSATQSSVCLVRFAWIGALKKGRFQPQIVRLGHTSLG